jgi:hypothetical protein
MDEGGGASRSTDPAAGSSAATDVSLREHFEALRQCDRELARERMLNLRDIAIVRREGDQFAISTALASAKELAEKHNDLIRSAEKKDETYATKIDLDRLANIQSKMIGGLIVIAAIGLTNLVRLWTG